jgi:multimeric flavodoxin WrbA
MRYMMPFPKSPTIPLQYYLNIDNSDAHAKHLIIDTLTSKINVQRKYNLEHHFSYMKITVLHGSPRKGKNSDTLANHFLKGINSSEEHSVNHFYLNKLSITACQGCLSCARPPHQCRINDDMQPIYESYKESDIILWASPMYWGYLTAQIKLVQDRMEALAWDGFGNKTFVVIMTYRHHYQSAASMFERISPHFGINLNILECCTYHPETKKDIPISNIQDKLLEAYNLGIKLGQP